MRYIKVFEKYQSDEEIHEICNYFGITNYTINNGVVDVDGDVYLSHSKLTKLPLLFGSVTGCFNCRENRLTSLEGCPTSVGKYFDCSDNKLKSLEGCPTSVGGNFFCNFNKIIELLWINRIGNLYCNANPIDNIWNLFRNETKIELFNYMDPIRPPEKKGGLPIVYLTVLNAFLEQIGKEPVTTVKGYKCI